MKQICVVTSTRADYGLLRPLLLRLTAAPRVAVRLVVSGTHLRPEFGNTIWEIKADNLPVHRCIDIGQEDDSSVGMSRAMARALETFADYFAETAPDLLVALGDRHEIAAVCCAAVNQRIPIAHLYGGEITLGAIDDYYRHAITKMSALHFTSCETYRKRVIQMGERPERVFNVGALGVENALSLSLPDLDELSAFLRFRLEPEKYVVVTFHPVTMENDVGEAQTRELSAAMECFPDLLFIITMANSDAGGRRINRMWKQYASTRDNCLLKSSLGATRYLTALRHSAMMLGNSSSGIIEGPAMRIPTVNIGDRQLGRMRADSVIDCKPERADIAKAISRALTPEFRATAALAANPFGDGRTSEKILAVIMDFLQHDTSTNRKIFYDLDAR